ncbi:tail completion protein gp17 [Limnobaculum xujianqingii]|uniref:tail completion protein gp17 n=1 Tax=Limnobaculum xujianqingii TaxID=2738837 RepID=UPI00112D6E45|nr:DUF3168 domain-containing protein [Limnobaculum xujianqingii]
MTEADVYSRIADLADQKVYPYVVKLNAAGEPAVSPPWVIFSIISQNPADVLCGTAEEWNSLQIDVYSNKLAESRAIRAKVIKALSSLSLTDQQLLQGYDSETGLYRATLDTRIID